MESEDLKLTVNTILAPLKSSLPENKKITSQLMLIQNILFQQLLIHYRLAF